MSGILGVWNSQKPTPWQQMLDDLTVLGRDGKGDWHDTSVGLSLGRTQLFNTPESAKESPVVEYEGCVLVWDGRIDDRESLVTEQNLTDAQLIIESYRRWGIDCIQHLIGEFVFVLWDAKEDLLFVGCDAIGERTCSYYWDGRTLLLSSRVLTLLLHPQVSCELDDIYLIHTICDLRTHLPGVTAFKNIKRLIPGSALILKSGRLQQQHIGHLVEVKERKSFSSPEIYYEEFWHLLNQSVRDRLRGKDSSCVMLSGGLDSTTIAVSLLNNLSKVDAFSITTDTYPEFDERKPIDSFLQRYPQINWHQVNCDRAWALSEPWEELPITDDPLMSPTMPMTIEVMSQIQNSGFSSFFDGNWGDEIFHTTVTELMLAGKPKEAFNYFKNDKYWYSALWREFVVPYLPRFLRLKWFAKCQRKSKLIPAWLDPAYTQTPQMQIAIEQHYENCLSEFDTPKQVVEWIARSGGFVGLKQAYQLFSAVHQLESVSPFKDRRIVEFAINLHPSLQYDSTHSKIFLRQVNQDILPEDIRWQPKYNYFDPLKYAGIAQNELTSSLLEEAEKISYLNQIIDFDCLRSVLIDYRHDFINNYRPWQKLNSCNLNQLYTLLSFINWYLLIDKKYC